VKVYDSKDIRNVGVVGHGDSGKTTLTAGLLFTSGATNRLLRVDEGNTITDFDDEEISRKITISTAIAVAEWKKPKSTSSIPPATTSLLMTPAPPWWPPIPPWSWWMAWPASKCRPKRSGDFTNDFKLPRAVVINKLDRERADFERALASVQENFGRAAVPVQIPIGAEREFKGVVDLVRMKAYTYTHPTATARARERDSRQPGRRRPEGPRSAHRDGGRGQ
jgi:elongation factor G